MCTGQIGGVDVVNFYGHDQEKVTALEIDHKRAAHQA